MDVKREYNTEWLGMTTVMKECPDEVTNVGKNTEKLTDECESDVKHLRTAVYKNGVGNHQKDPEITLKCKVCERVFNEQSDLDVHMGTHVKSESHVCSRCGKAFVTKEYLETHVRKHTSVAKDPSNVNAKTGKIALHKCVKCGKIFAGENFFEKHMRTHANEGIYETQRELQSGKTSDVKELATICTRKVIKNEDPDDLNPHWKAHIKSYKCSICSKLFANQVNLNRHTKRHAQIRCHKCGICGKGFTQRGHLGQHMRIHTIERRYKCSLCYKSFDFESNLIVHTDTHFRQGSFKCSVCSKHYQDRATLVHHLKIHTGERPHRCGICGKGFLERRNMVEHVRLHTGEKPYKCLLCHKAFTHKRVLQRHQRNHGFEKV